MGESHWLFPFPFELEYSSILASIINYTGIHTEQEMHTHNMHTQPLTCIHLSTPHSEHIQLHAHRLCIYIPHNNVMTEDTFHWYQLEGGWKSSWFSTMMLQSSLGQNCTEWEHIVLMATHCSIHCHRSQHGLLVVLPFSPSLLSTHLTYLKVYHLSHFGKL